MKARGAVSVMLVIVAASCTDANAPSSARMPDGKEWTTVNLNVTSVPSYCYEDTDSHCSQYGRLYTWDSAKTGCQSLGNGWRLPTDEEWQALAKGYGGLLSDSAEESKKASSALLMGGSADFNAMRGGNRGADGRYDRLNAHGLYWTASESGTGTAWFYNFGSLGLSRHKAGDKQMAVSVRCIRVPE